jgi:DNA-directed RNA polymerase subunit K/omega
MDQQHQFTKYEVARIIGARALQIAMDAPLLIKISEDELKSLNYDALRIAERELDSGILPISIHRPQPRRLREKIKSLRVEEVTDEELIEKEKRSRKRNC